MSSSYITYVDSVINVYQTLGETDRIGFSSPYASKPHPATNKIIEGWRWDKRTWPSENEEEQVYCVPTLYDPPFYTAVDSDWQSGIGHGDDLKLLEVVSAVYNDRTCWVPKVQHGYFYLYDQEYFLYSEGLVTEIAQTLFDAGGFQYTKLTGIPKSTVPVRVYNYFFDKTRGQYTLHREAKKRSDFTPLALSGVYFDVRDESNNLIHDNINVSEPEFIIEYDDDDAYPTIILNGNYLTSVHDGVTISGISTPVEVMGEATGGPDQLFYTYYSPLSSGVLVKVYTYPNLYDITEWTVLSGVNPQFTCGEHLECILDHDMGTLQFGNYDPMTGLGSGLMPAYGHKIAIQYSGTMFIDYEEVDTPDYRLAHDANLNLLHGVSPRGFIHARAGGTNPASVSLTADLPLLSTGKYGPLSLGYAYARLLCQVTDEWGGALEGQTVQFELVNKALGTFGLDQLTTEAVTSYTGEAVAFYNPPLDVDGMGDATAQVQVSGENSTLFFENLMPPSAEDSLYLYKVARRDTLTGWPHSELLGSGGYYDTYFQTELIGHDGSQYTTSLEGEEAWEGLFRNTYDLPTPTTYETGDLITGSKQIVLSWDEQALHPELGIRGAWRPLQPSQYFVTESGVGIRYATVLDDIVSSGTFRSYFVAASSEVQVRASVYSPVLKRRIYSNTITISLTIPDSMNGTYIADSLALLPSGLLVRPKNDTEFQEYFDDLVYDGSSWLETSLEEAYYKERDWDTTLAVHETPWQWFTRTRRGDNVLLGMEPVVVTESGIATIPLGFRIRSDGITLASALDGVVFLNPNSTMLSGVFE